jgi:hypothetical protein
MFQSPQITNSRPARAHLLEARHEDVHELVLPRLGRLAHGARGHVERDHAEVSHVHLEEAPLLVDLRDAEADHHVLGLVPRIDRHTAVAALLRRMEEGVQRARREELARQVGFVRLDFLQAHEVGLLPPHPWGEALGVRRPQPVHVQGDDSHGICRQDRAGSARIAG